MSSKPENQPKAKRLDRHKTVKVQAGVTPEYKAKVKEWGKSQGLKDESATVIKLIDLSLGESQGLQTYDEFADVQECEYHSEIIGQKDYCDCKKPPARRVKTTKCLDCKMSKVKRARITTMEKLDQLCSKKKQDLEYQTKHLEEIETKIEAGQAELQKLDSNTEAGLRNKINELEKNAKITDDILRKTTRQYQDLEVNYGLLCKEQKASLKKTEELESKVKTMQEASLKKINELENNIKTTQQESACLEMDNFQLQEKLMYRKIAPKAETRSQIIEQQRPAEDKSLNVPASIERTTKEKETTEKIVFQPMTLCPLRHENVNIEQECKRNCQVFAMCPTYYDNVKP